MKSLDSWDHAHQGIARLFESPDKKQLEGEWIRDAKENSGLDQLPTHGPYYPCYLVGKDVQPNPN